MNDFKSLCELTASDRIIETLDRELIIHIAVKQGETYFNPQQPGREFDTDESSKGKCKSTSKIVIGETKRFMGNKLLKTLNWCFNKNI